MGRPRRLRKVCVVCGNEYPAASNGQKYCRRCGAKVRQAQAKIRKERWKERQAALKVALAVNQNA